MNLSFRDFFATTAWSDDLRDADKHWDYYHSFNEQVYGVPFEYDDVIDSLPEYADMAGSMVTESRKKKQAESSPESEDDYEDDADVEPSAKKEKEIEDGDRVMNFTRGQWKDHEERIKSMFRPKRDTKTGKLRNPHAGVSLVSPGDNNPKTEKGYAGEVPNPHTGHKRKFKNAVMHLLPAGFSGCNTCSAHTPECAASCLDVAGNPGFMGVKTSGRARRTFMFAYNKVTALTKLAREIERMVEEANGANLNFGLRLNGTSDIPWESKKYQFVYKRKNSPGKRSKKVRGMDCPADTDGKPSAKSIFCHFPEVQFYDYTKVYKRSLDHAKGDLPPNYHLTFSYSEKTNPKQMEELLDAGGNVAMVFAFAEKNYDHDKAMATRRKRASLRANAAGTDYVEPEEDPSVDYSKGREMAVDAGPYKLPKVWRGENGKTYKVVSGDIHDLRFIDDLQKNGKEGVIVGLAAKGDAKYVQSNGTKQVFVVQPSDPHLRYEEENRGWIVAATQAGPKRLKTVETRQKQDAAFVAELRAKAAKLEDGDPEKEELLDRAERIGSGKVNYFGPNAQRDRSNAMYALAKSPDPITGDNPDGLSPLEQTRKAFKVRAGRDMEVRIRREIRDQEREDGRKWSDEEKDEYMDAKKREYASDYDGLPAWNKDRPHSLATDRGQAPQELLSLGIRGMSPLDKHIRQHRDEFDKHYNAVLGDRGSTPSFGPSAGPLDGLPAVVPAKRGVRAENTNPYLAGLLHLCS